MIRVLHTDDPGIEWHAAEGPHTSRARLLAALARIPHPPGAIAAALAAEGVVAFLALAGLLLVLSP